MICGVRLAGYLLLREPGIYPNTIPGCLPEYDIGYLLSTTKTTEFGIWVPRSILKYQVYEVPFRVSCDAITLPLRMRGKSISDADNAPLCAVPLQE